MISSAIYSISDTICVDNNTIFSDAIIKLKHATKSVADASDKVLEKDEVLLVSPNSGSGTGAYEMRVGDGSTPVKNLPVAINGMKADNINVEEIETIEEENPTLEGGNAIKNLFGRISKKFSWLETMLGKKVNTADIYDGLDSSNAGKVASANAVRQINEKTDKNTTDISTLTSNLAIVSSCISNVYIKKIANEGEYTQVFATSIIDSSHFCGLVIADGGLYSFHNIGNVTALVNRSTYKVACNSVGKVARLSITGMGTWDECVIISNRDFTLTHK